MPPLPFVFCTPPLPFISCLPAGCRVVPVVPLPPPPPLLHNFASTSFSSSGCQLTRPHLPCRHRLSSSSHLCLATCRLRLSTRRRLTTDCVDAVADAQTLLTSMRRHLCRRCYCDCRPSQLSPLLLVVKLVSLSSSSLSLTSMSVAIVVVIVFRCSVVIVVDFVAHHPSRHRNRRAHTMS